MASRVRVWSSRIASLRASEPGSVVSRIRSRWARVRVLNTVIAEIEDGMRRAGMEVPVSEDLADEDVTD